MTFDIDAFKADMPADVLAILDSADAPYSRPEAAEPALQAAVQKAPDNLALRIASYAFYFYANRLHEAIPHAEACLAIAARALGVAEDWRLVDRSSADFSDPARPQRVYLKSLFALGFCRARLGDVETALPILHKVASLDAKDELGSKTLIGFLQRGGASAESDGDDED